MAGSNLVIITQSESLIILTIKSIDYGNRISSEYSVSIWFIVSRKSN